MTTRPCYPLIEEIDHGLSPLDTFELFRDEPFCFFLDSGMDHHKLGRYSFIGGSPFQVFTSRGSQCTIRQGSEETFLGGNPFDILGHFLERYRLDSSDLPVPFAGGAVGYLSYDLCHFIERLPSTAVDDLNLPECSFGFYDVVLAFDNLQGRAYIVSTGFPELKGVARLERARERLSEVKTRLTNKTGCLAPAIPARAAAGALRGGLPMRNMSLLSKRRGNTLLTVISSR